MIFSLSDTARTGPHFKQGSEIMTVPSRKKTQASATPSKKTEEMRVPELTGEALEKYLDFSAKLRKRGEREFHRKMSHTKIPFEEFGLN